MSDPQPQPLNFGDFPAVEEGDWRGKVADELGEDALHRLQSRDADGLTRRPLYGASDLPGEVARRPQQPGALPSWRVGQDIDLTDAGAEETASQAIALGVKLLWLVGEGAPDAIRALCEEHNVEALEASNEQLLSLTKYHEAGAGVVDELAFLLAETVELLRGGIYATEVEMAVGSDVFAEIAKLRATRTLWAKLHAACGVPETPLRIHARTSERTRSQIDPWGNLLRGGAQGFAAVVGGVDSLRVAPNLEATDIEGGLSAELAQRIAVNAQHVLAEEAHLARVQDPAGGSYYLEAFTDQIAREAWEVFREIERGGGLARRKEEGWVTQRLEETAEKRRQATAKRRDVLVGVSEFARLDEDVSFKEEAGTENAEGTINLRLAAPFEKLRARAAAHKERPRATLLRFGAEKDSRARADFAARFLAAGGIEASESEDASILVLCAGDADYPKQVPAMQEKLAGRIVVLAGRPGEHEAALRSAGVDAFIHLGCDAVSVLGTLHDRLSQDA